MKSARTLPLILLAALVSQPAAADAVYKWVDSQGQVTYSSTPPPGGVKAEKIETLPSPPEEDIRQAEERLKRTQEQAGELESQRLKQEEKEAEEARLRAAQKPQPPIVIEKPVYVPQPMYYPPAIRPPGGRPPHKPQPRPLPQPQTQPQPQPR